MYSSVEYQEMSVELVHTVKFGPTLSVHIAVSACVNIPALYSHYGSLEQVLRSLAKVCKIQNWCREEVHLSRSFCSVR